MDLPPEFWQYTIPAVVTAIGLYVLDARSKQRTESTQSKVANIASVPSGDSVIDEIKDLLLRIENRLDRQDSRIDVLTKYVLRSILPKQRNKDGDLTTGE